MSRLDKAKVFGDLHRRENPLVLYNIWDAGGAKALAGAGAPAIATGSWSVAAAHGYEDGQAIPLELVLSIVERICTSVDVPVTVDFEGGYGADPDEVAENVKRVLLAGAVGINFEDRIIGGNGLYTVAEQCDRIAAIRRMAVTADLPVFINARTDVFLSSDPAAHRGLISEAIEREAAYAEAGADGFFVPGLIDTGLLSKITQSATLPVNAMMLGEFSSAKKLIGCGISRFSYGPAPYLNAMDDLKARFKDL